MRERKDRVSRQLCLAGSRSRLVVGQRWQLTEENHVEREYRQGQGAFYDRTDGGDQEPRDEGRLCVAPVLAIRYVLIVQVLEILALAGVRFHLIRQADLDEDLLFPRPPSRGHLGPMSAKSATFSPFPVLRFPLPSSLRPTPQSVVPPFPSPIPKSERRQQSQVAPTEQVEGVSFHHHLSLSLSRSGSPIERVLCRAFRAAGMRSRGWRCLIPPCATDSLFVPLLAGLSRFVPVFVWPKCRLLCWGGQGEAGNGLGGEKKSGCSTRMNDKNKWTRLTLHVTDGKKNSVHQRTPQLKYGTTRNATRLPVHHVRP